MPFKVVVIDPRPDWAGTVLAEPLEYAQQYSWSPEDAVCIFTHSHDLDFALAKFFLTKPVGYLGLIGSEHKARVFQARLMEAGGETLRDLWDERMRCPIGIPLDSKVPKVIAVSIAAELLKEWALISKKPEPVS